MKLNDLSKALGWTNLTPELDVEPDPEVEAGYVSDLLSDVLANAPPSCVWVTVQVHMNVIAVATHAGLAAVVFAAHRKPEEAVRLKALEEKIRLYTSNLSAFDLIGCLYDAGVRGGPA